MPPTSARTSRRVRSLPALSATQRAEAEQVARRLQGELRHALQLLPPNKRGASGLSRHLKIDRATCQRIVCCVAKPDADAMMLVSLPGVQGLRLFLDAFGLVVKTPAAAQTLHGVRAAVGAFEAFLGAVGVSQRGLRELLSARQEESEQIASGAGQDDRATRKALYHAAFAVVGRASDTLVSLRVVRPLPGTPRHTESINVRGVVGHAARSNGIGATPLEIGAHAAVSPDGGRPMFRALGPNTGDPTGPWGGVLTKFCSTPQPKIVTRLDGGRLLHIVEPTGGGDEPFDFFVASRSGQPEPHPETLNPPVGEMSTLIQFPARQLIFATYVHRDIAKRCTPSLQVHLWTPTGSHVTGRWSTQVPGGPTLAPRLDSEGWPPMESLVEHVFRLAEWDADDFVCFSTRVEYPLWRCGYHLQFDFTARDA